MENLGYNISALKKNYSNNSNRDSSINLVVTRKRTSTKNEMTPNRSNNVDVTDKRCIEIVRQNKVENIENETPIHHSTPVHKRLKHSIDVHCPNSDNYLTQANVPEHSRKLNALIKSQFVIKRKQPVTGLTTKTYFSDDLNETINDTQYNNLLDSIEDSFRKQSHQDKIINAEDSPTNKQYNIVNLSKVSTSITNATDSIKSLSNNRQVSQNLPQISYINENIHDKSSPKNYLLNLPTNTRYCDKFSKKSLHKDIQRNEFGTENIANKNLASFKNAIQFEENRQILQNVNKPIEDQTHLHSYNTEIIPSSEHSDDEDCENVILSSQYGECLQLSTPKLIHLENEASNQNCTQFSQNCTQMRPDMFRKPTETLDFERDTIDETILNDTAFTTSSQYSKEIDNLFSKIESKIIEYGSNNFEMSSIKNTPEINLNNSEHLINEFLNTSDIWMQLENEKSSFSSDIKRTIMSNIKKPVVVAPTVNKTIIEHQKAEICSLGPFYDLPNQVKELVKQFKGIDRLYEWQDECLKLDAIKTRKNLIYALPTSGGKTLVAEILMLREIMCRKLNVLFVLPYVSIVQEKIWELSPFAVALDFLVEEYAAGKGSYPPRKRRCKQSIYVATMEKGLGLVNSLIELNRLDEIGLIVIDELHLVGEGDRGATLEGLLTKVMFLNVGIQIVGMSATIGNIQDICKYLKSEIYTRNFRPVQLTEYIQCAKEIARIDFNAKEKDEAFVYERIANHLYTESMEKLDPDHLGGLIMEVIPKGSCLVFCASKRNCENVAILVCKTFTKEIFEHKQKEKWHLLQALKTESGNICPVLSGCLPFGVAYHHSGLTSDERKLIEDGFRNGILNVICCTSTLAAGVNLPAKRVIIRSPYVGRDFMTLSRYKQMVGRAGRTGFGESGDSILICNSQDLMKVKKMLLAPMDEALSQMTANANSGLSNLLLSSISLGIAVTRKELRNVVDCTLLAVQQERLNANTKLLTDAVITDLFKKSAIHVHGESEPLTTDRNPESENIADSTLVSVLDCSTASSLNSSSKRRKLKIWNDSKLVISKLGRAAIKGGLSLSKAELLHKDLVTAQSALVLLDCLHLLYLVTPYDVADTIKPDMTNFYYILDEMGPATQKTASVLGIDEFCKRRMQLGQTIKKVDASVMRRFYLTLALYDLWKGAIVYDVAEKFKISRGVVQQLMTVSTSFSFNVVHFCEEIDEFWMFADLIRGMSNRLQYCCTKELTPLMELPSVKQGRAKQLFKAGYTNLQKIAKATPEDLIYQIDYMTRKVANELIATAKLVLLAKVNSLREQAEDVLGVDIANLDESCLILQ